MRSLVPSDYSQVTFSGGSLAYDLSASGRSQVNIRGGSIGNRLIADYDSVITIHGSDFAVDGQLFGYGELTSMFRLAPTVDPPRQLTGTLLSGDLLDNSFYIGSNASIVLIPEPSTLLLLGLGGVALRRKHRAK